MLASVYSVNALTLPSEALIKTDTYNHATVTRVVSNPAFIAKLDGKQVFSPICPEGSLPTWHSNT